MKNKRKILSKEYYNLHSFLCNIAIFSFFLLMLAVCYLKLSTNHIHSEPLFFMTIIFLIIFTFRKAGLNERYEILKAIKKQEIQNEDNSTD